MYLQNNIVFFRSFESTLKWLWSQWQHKYERNLESILIDQPNLDERLTKKRDPWSMLATLSVDVWSKSSSSFAKSNWCARYSSGSPLQILRVAQSRFRTFFFSRQMTLPCQLNSCVCNFTYFVGIRLMRKCPCFSHCCFLAYSSLTNCTTIDPSS